MGPGPFWAWQRFQCNSIMFLMVLAACCVGAAATISDDLRWRMIYLRFEDMIPVAAICTLLRLKRSTVFSTISFFLETGCVSQNELRGGKQKRVRRTRIDGSNLHFLKRVIDQDPRLYLDEIQDYLEDYSKEKFSFKCILGALRRLG